MVRQSVRFTLVMMVLLGLFYPLTVTGLASVFFPRQAAGSLVKAPDGRVVGSELIGQAVTSPGLFTGRPSGVGYNAAGSGSSSLGPSNPKLVARVKQEMADWQTANPGQPVPPELVTESASGLDPQISPEAALVQVPRVSRATGIPEADLRQMVADHTDGRTFGVLGQPRVNLLRLNLAVLQRQKG